VHFIIIYTIEAHPAGSNSPYSSDEWTANYSTDKEGNSVYQPESYEERLDLAQMIVAEEDLQVLLLVDEIDNPLWCTYGPAPNIAYLIGKDGKIVAKQGWYNPTTMESAILEYLSGG